MVKKSNIFLFIALLFITGSNTQCTKEGFCRNKALCDLFSRTVVPLSQVVLGVDLTIVSSVYNHIASNIDCGTENAPESKSNFDVEFRANSSSPWETIQAVSDLVLPVGILIADGASDDTNITLLFNDPGEYRFKTFCDAPREISERDEANNESCAGCRSSATSSNNESYSEILTVIPNPDIPYDSSKPQVVIKKIFK